MTEAAAALHDAAVLSQPYEPQLLDLTLIVSCYNEQKYIAETLDTVCAAASQAGLSFEIIVIDDCSQDDSVQVIRDYIASHPQERILMRINSVNKGLAQNYFDGAFMGKGKYYRLICGDNGEPRESLLSVFSSIGQADCIVPYYVRNEHRGLCRRIISKSYTTLINIITGNQIHYYNGLAVHLRHNVMRWHPNTDGFGFQADILCMLLDLGFSYQQVPIVTVERREGKSNAVTLSNCLSVLHSISEILIRRLSRVTDKNKRKRPRSIGCQALSHAPR